MDKRSAMDRVNEHCGSRLLDGGNTSFANINASKPVWWININPSKFKSDLHLLLAKEGDGGLIWLRIEGNSFPDVRKVFRVRQDKDCIDLEISSRPPKYMTDVKSGGTEYNFTKHIEYEWGPDQELDASLDTNFTGMKGYVDTAVDTLTVEMDRQFKELRGDMDRQFQKVTWRFQELTITLDAKFAEVLAAIRDHRHGP